MADIKLQIVNIKTVVNALLESKALPDCFGLRSSQDFQGNNEYYLEVHIGKWESEDFTNYRDTTIELKIWDTEEELKAIIQVYDFPEVEDVNNYTPLLPFLKDYLKKHPLLQFPNYPRKYDNIEYGGYAFSNDNYVPLSEEIEVCKPDQYIYEKVFANPEYKNM